VILHEKAKLEQKNTGQKAHTLSSFLLRLMLIKQIKGII